MTDDTKPPTIDLAHLRALASTATGGPWLSGEGYEQSSPGHYVYDATTSAIVCASQDGTDCPLLKYDAEFIAAANPATVLALIDRVEGAERALHEATALLAGMQQTIAAGATSDLAAVIDAAQAQLSGALGSSPSPTPLPASAPLFDVAPEHRAAADQLARKLSAHGFKCDGDDVILASNLALLAEAYLRDAVDPLIHTPATVGFASGESPEHLAARLQLAQLIRRVHATGSIDEIMTDVTAIFVAMLGAYTQAAVKRRKLKHPGG